MLRQVTFTFHGGLNDFLPAGLRRRRVVHAFTGSPAVKDSIEARGVPHPEVGLILVEGKPVKFDYRLESGRGIEVYPPFRHPPFAAEHLLPVRPPGPPAFMLDVHLGILARFLRMLGFDTLYDSRDLGDAHLAYTASREHRILLTRDIGLLKRSAVVYGRFVRNKNPKKQVTETVHHYRLSRQDCRPFSRCLDCNQRLVAVTRHQVANRLPELVLEKHREFRYCGLCTKIYWKGTHYFNMKAMIDKLWPGDAPLFESQVTCATGGGSGRYRMEKP